MAALLFAEQLHEGMVEGKCWVQSSDPDCQCSAAVLTASCARAGNERDCGIWDAVSASS